MKKLPQIILILLVFICACETNETAPEIEATSPVAFLNLLQGEGKISFTIDDQNKATDLTFKQNSLFYNVPLGSQIVTVTNQDGHVLLTQEVELEEYSRYYFYIIKDTQGEYLLGSGEREGRYRGTRNDSKADYRGVDLLQTSTNLPFPSIALSNRSTYEAYYRVSTKIFPWFDNITPNLRQSNIRATALCGSNPVSNELIFSNAGEINQLSTGYSSLGTNPNEILLPSFPGRLNLGPIDIRKFDLLIVIFDDPNQEVGFDGLIINWDTVAFSD